jgi:sarcosine oxidase gamma subunit
MRLVAMPVLTAAVFEALKKASARLGSVGVASSDADLDATVLSVLLDAAPAQALHAVATALRDASAKTHLRFELQGEIAQLASAELERDLAAALGVLGSAHVVRRDAPASAWSRTRPVTNFSPDEPRVSVEIGAPTILLKATFPGAPAHALANLADAVAGATSGFADVGAWPGAGRGATPCLLLEFGDVARAPLHRVLDVLDIEARRYGAVVGACALLSHAPLEALLGTLSGRLNVPVAQKQIIETHLSELST